MKVVLATYPHIQNSPSITTILPYPIPLSLHTPPSFQSSPPHLSSMATIPFQSLHHLLPKHHHLLPPADASLCLNPTTTIPSSSLSYKLISNSSTSLNATSTTSIPAGTSSLSFDLLEQHLASQDFRQADEETRRLLIVLAGEAAVKRGYVFFSEVQFISELDLRAMDELWLQHSDGRYGYSVQKRIWEKSRRDFTKFFVKVGWMKKLDTEVEQYSYRAFPDEFYWEMDDKTPEGHLPLTNALRGTQLLNRILTHPAFQAGEEEEEVLVVEENEGKGEEVRQSTKPLPRTFKTDYSF